MKNTLSLLLCGLLLFCDCDNDGNQLPSPCTLVPDAGPCYALITKYYFDRAEQRCKEFTWGGCHGVVPFHTLEECRQCLSANRCDLVPDPGPCKAMFTKYYFDKADQKCKEFIWGGCEGVVPFHTLEECQQCQGAP